MENYVKNHYIKTASKNSAEALSIAMYLWTINYKNNTIDNRAIQDLVQIINVASIKLKNTCLSELHE